MSLTWSFRAHSEIGLVRKNNQDSGFVGRHLLLVADGMGGAAAGDLASAVAVDSIRGVDAEVDPAEADSETRLGLLTNAIHEANSRIADLISEDHNLEGMGTTVTGGLMIDGRFSLAHLGDSRAYLLREGRLERLTHDHSWVQSLVDDGKISEEEAAVHPHRSLLLKVLNGQPSNEPDLTTVDLQAGDRLLLCSDGLCGFVEDADIEADLGAESLDDAMALLIEAAHAAGGLDNITIILAEITDAGADAALAETPQVLGAAAERDIPTNDTMIRSRADLAAAAGNADDADGARTDGAGEDEDRYAPQAPHRRRFLRPLVGLLIVVLVLGAGLGAGFAWSRTQYYVGADADQVAIFQGLSDGIPGLPLSRVYEVQQVKVSSLPVLYQDMVRSTIDVADLDTARITVDQLRDAAARCEQERRSSATPKPSGSARPSSSGKPSTTGKPTTTGKPSISATPTDKSSAVASGQATGAPGSASPTSTATGTLPGGNQAC